MIKAKQFDYILFDLDGTLSDSSEGIVKSVKEALDLGGFTATLDELYSFIGPSLRESFSRFTDDEELRAQMLAAYRSRYEVCGWRENIPYEGMGELLHGLKERGKHVVLASAKPELFCKKILEYFGFTHYFDFIGGADMDGKRDDKTVLLDYVFENIGKENKERAVMVGDRKFDIIAAHNHNIPCIAVTYGFAPKGELEEAGADYVAQSVAELGKILLD